MKRVIHGYFDILFLDEDMRITKGNRGSIVIMTRECGGDLNHNIKAMEEKIIWEIHPRWKSVEQPRGQS